LTASSQVAIVVGRLDWVTVICPTVVVGYSSHDAGVVLAVGCPEGL
jgi:hypothetical protein